MPTHLGGDYEPTPSRSMEDHLAKANHLSMKNLRSNRGGYSMSTSAGWAGDKLAWSGTTSGLMKTETRSTLTKKSDPEYRVLGERMEAGKWVTGNDETCKKK